MKFKSFVIALILLLSAFLGTSAFASMLGLCNNSDHTQYICCPASGGWIVSRDCNSGASSYCKNDTGLIAGSNPPVTILQDCKNRGGSYVQYFMKNILSLAKKARGLH